MRERMSFAGRRGGLEFWVRWAALRAFLARDREVGGFWNGDGGGVVDESLSESEVGSGCAGCRGIMSSLSFNAEGACMWARESSGSSVSCDGLVGAMALNGGGGWGWVWLGGERGDLWGKTDSLFPMPIFFTFFDGMMVEWK